MAITDLDSIGKRLASIESGGALRRTIRTQRAASTVANTTSGYINMGRFPDVFTIPSVSGYTGYELTAKIISTASVHLIVGIEYDLGVLTMSSNTFAAGLDSSMPTKSTRIEGTTYSARQTGTVIPLLTVSTSLTATTPVITTTYINEDGTGSRTCSMTLPTNALLGSAFLMTPHLNSGDTGLQDVTNMSRSAGTAGELRVRALLPLDVYGVTTTPRGVPHIRKPIAPVLATPGDRIACYVYDNSASEVVYSLYGRPI